MINIYKTSNNGWQLNIKSSLYKIISLLISEDMLLNKKNIKSIKKDYKIDLIKKILNYIHENYNDKIYIEDLALEANMNVQYFCRFFKSVIGKTPVEYINSYRIEKATELLQTETLSISNIALTVGETWGATPEIAKLYSSPNRKELSMVFQFEVISLDKQEGKSRWDLAPLDFIKFKETFKKWQVELYEEGWNSLFGNNHDLPRMVSRWGNDKEFRVESAKMLATMLHMQKGTPYIYQGEEIGMTNIRLNSIKDYNDIETLNVYKARRALGYSEQDVMNSIYAKSRDNGRTPMQWSKEKNAGFTEGKAWLHINDNYRYINVEDSINDENSILNYYKKLIKLRRENDVIKYGTFELILDNHKEVFAYIRKYKNIELLVICNFYSNNIEIELPNEYSEYSYETLLTNYTDSAKFSNVISLRPYETIVYKLEK